jgi:hypothetical protein
MLGVAVPVTPIAAVFPVAGTLWLAPLRGPWTVFGPISAPFIGFGLGQGLQETYQPTSNDPPPPQCSCHPPESDPGREVQGKEITITWEGAPPTPGCSPVALTEVPVRQARKWLVPLVALQVALAAAMLVRRRRQGGCA